jgi:GxxExxY protein
VERWQLDQVSGAIVDSSVRVHTSLGPGLLETPYRRCLAHALRMRGFSVMEEMSLGIHFDGLHIPDAYKIDMVVNDCVVVEVKSISHLLPVHHAQVLTYLRLTGHRVGLLINFHVAHLREGIKRLVNDY